MASLRVVHKESVRLILLVSPRQMIDMFRDSPVDGDHCTACLA